MATEAPPSYDEVVNQVKANVQKIIAENPEKGAKFVTAFVENLEESGTLLEEIRELAAQSGRIDKLFQEVLADLSAIRGPDSGIDYKARWENFYDKYRTLMKDSGNSVQKIKTCLREFESEVAPVILKLKNNPNIHAEVMEVLNIFLKKVTVAESPATLENINDIGDMHSAKFFELEKEILTFIGEFTQYATKQGRQLNESIAQAQKHLELLKEQLEDLHTKMVKTGTDIAFAAFGVVLGAVTATAAAGPLGFFTALAAGISTIAPDIALLKKTLDDKKAKQEELNTAQQTFDGLNTEMDELDKVVITFKGKKKDIYTICAHIGRLDAVWQLLAYDVKEFRDTLTRAAHTIPEHETLFFVRVENCQKLYSILHKALGEYILHKGAAT